MRLAMLLVAKHEMLVKSEMGALTASYRIVVMAVVLFVSDQCMYSDLEKTSAISCIIPMCMYTGWVLRGAVVCSKNC